MPGFSIFLIIIDIWRGFEYASSTKYVRVLHMPLYSYNDIIIIVTNVIILEFFPAQFVHSGAPFFLTRIKTRITKANKLLTNFLFDYNDVRTFKESIWTAGCVFEFLNVKRLVVFPKMFHLDRGWSTGFLWLLIFNI